MGGALGGLTRDRPSSPITFFPCGLASAVMCAVDSCSLPDGSGKPISYASHILTSWSKLKEIMLRLRRRRSREKRRFESSVFRHKFVHNNHCLEINPFLRYMGPSLGTEPKKSSYDLSCNMHLPMVSIKECQANVLSRSSRKTQGERWHFQLFAFQKKLVHSFIGSREH